MKKTLPVILLLSLFFAQDSFAATQTSTSSQLLPPPVSVINWHKQVRTVNMRGLYMSMTPKTDAVGAMTITGGGMLMDYNDGWSEHFGGSYNLTMMGMTGKSEDQYSTNSMGTFMFNLNPNIVWTPINGEKKDIAGEVTKTGFSLALYGGYGMSLMSFGTSQDIIPTQTTRTSDSMSMSMFSMDYGVVMEVPIAWWISIMPSYNITKYTGGSVSVGGESYSIDGADLPAQAIFGADILVRPMKLNPNLLVSLAALTGLVSGNSDNSNYNSTMIMLGIQYEWGKHYSSTFISPGITK